MTRIQQLASSNEIHWGNCTRSIGSRGGVKEHSTVCRINGSLKTWKTRPEDFRLPVKHGMRGYGEVVPSNIAEFHLPEECPLRETAEAVANDVHQTRIQPVTVPILGDQEFYRAICTCGYVAKEHFSSHEAWQDAQNHIGAAVSIT